MAARFCFKCGAPLLAEAAFCAQCGVAVATQPELTPEPSAPTAPTPTPEPSAPTAPLTPPAKASPLRSPNTAYGVIAGVVALLLISVAFIYSCSADSGDPTTAPGEILLEPYDWPGEAPFTASVETGSTPAPIQPVSAASPSPSSAPDRTGIRSVQGSAPGLYGGTQNERSCDPEKLINFLTANPRKAQAWAAVQGIAVNQIPAFVRSLTPVILRADTRVTNYGYYKGRATPTQSILEAGTAVLVDQLGQPRVKCNCGNPLAPPVPQTREVRYIGSRWPNFNPTRVINVVNTTKTLINNIVLVDVVNPGFFVRPTGIATDGTVGQDGPILIDSFCDLFPQECEEAGFGDLPDLGSGDVQITLRWNSTADLDLAAMDPTGQSINYESPSSSSGGQLDVDAHGDCKQLDRPPVENIFWPSGSAPDGTYRITVTYFAECPGGTGPQTFDLTVVMGGVLVPIEGMSTMTQDGRTETTFTVIPNAGPSQEPLETMGTSQLPKPQDEMTVEVKKPPADTNPPPDNPQPDGNNNPPPDNPQPDGNDNPPPENPPPDPNAGPLPGETWADFCARMYAQPPLEPVIGPENMEYTLCMHDPTNPDVPRDDGGSGEMVRELEENLANM